MPKHKDPDAQARQQARREARKHGYERRPTSAKEADEARRLMEGFACLQDSESESDAE